VIIKSSTIKLLVSIIFFILLEPSFSQEMLYQNKNIGFNVGANCAIGSHFQRFGVSVNFFYLNNFIQTNTEVRAYFSFKNLGPKFIDPELVFAQGIVFGYSSKQSFYNPFLSSISNQTGFKNSVGYSYNIYCNNIKTSQVTGIAAFQFDKISLITENDILAKPILDRFRTGAVLIQYQYQDIYQAAINCTMWTGKMGRSVETDRLEIYTKCYMDTTNGVYFNISHGLLSAQFKYNIGLSQTVQANLGIDAEQVRNAFQNKFIHNMKFIPKKWNKAKNCHIPMIDEDGNQYLFQPESKIRKPKLYWNVFSNPNIFY
jgi:hypothetical protein